MQAGKLAPPANAWLRADAAQGHAPFALDAFEPGETQEEADMVEPLARPRRGVFRIRARQGGQLEPAQMMREVHLRRRHDGLPISTAFVESAVNEIIAKRMIKKQQMR